MKSDNMVIELFEILKMPDYTEQVPPSGVFALAHRNDLLSALCEKINEDDQIPGQYRDVYQKEKILFENSLLIIDAFLEKCRSVGLHCYTIKSFLPFPYIDSNIDIVAVDPEEQYLLEEILKSMDFRRMYSLADIREPRKRMYRHRNNDENLPKLHIHQSISWNGIEYVDRTKVQDRNVNFTVDNIDIPIPSSEDAILIMAAHILFENKYLTMGDIYYFYLLSDSGLDWDYIWNSAHDYSWEVALKIFLEVMLGVAAIFDISITSIPESQVKRKLNVSKMPYILPVKESFRGTLSKLRLDMSQHQIKVLAREMFSYFLVDPLWMYRKAILKPKANI